jgi:hypothetical protein
MRSSVIWSFLSLVALSTGSLVAGCDSDATIAKSGVGESCDSSADCDDGLNCLQGACYKTAPTPDGGAGEGSGGSMVGPTPPVLGGENESCTKAADCAEGLGCFNQRCIKAPDGDGGDGNVPGGPSLGGPGETCGLTSDCEDGLKCLPNNVGGFDVKAAGSNSVGVCTPLDSGITPSGKTCGHECVEAVDCCELPIAVRDQLKAYSCADLAAKVADVADCSKATALGEGPLCLAYAAYCSDQCTNNTWSCDAGLCSYTANCSKPGQVIGGCPSVTRGGNPIAACNDDGKCAGAVGEPGCTTDKSCADKPVADSPLAEADTCSAGECVCHKDSGGCYRKCDEATDCPAANPLTGAGAYTCDTATSLCMPVGSCTNDVQCVVYFGDSLATCVEGACQPAGCEHDIDCNPGGLRNGSFYQVCSEGKCVALSGQCETDDECPAYVGGLGVRSFCAEAAGGSAPITPVSAITD